MKKLIYFIVLTLVAVSCSTNDEPEDASTTLNWEKTGDFSWPAREDGIAIESGGLVYMGYGKNADNQLLNDFWIFDPLNNTWEQASGVTTNNRELQFLDISNRLFLIADQQLSPFTLYEYNKLDDRWEERSNFSKEGTYYITAGFSVNGKGYYVPTEGANIWEYDPASDQWTKKSKIPGITSRDSEIFELNDKIYVYGLSGNLAGKMYVYDPSGDSWETVTTEGGPLVESGFASLSVSNLGYVIMGGSVTTDAMGNPTGSTVTGEIWEYDPDLNQWIPKPEFPGPNRTRMFSFTLEGNGYVGSGFTSGRDFLKDQWTFSVIK